MAQLDRGSGRAARGHRPDHPPLAQATRLPATGGRPWSYRWRPGLVLPRRPHSVGSSAGTHQAMSNDPRYRWAYSIAVVVLPTPPMPVTACTTAEPAELITPVALAGRGPGVRGRESAVNPCSRAASRPPGSV